MKKIILILLSVLIASAMKGQISNRFTYITTIGTGIPMNEPSSTPFTWQVSGPNASLPELEQDYLFMKKH